MELSLVIPAYNEESRIDRALGPSVDFLKRHYPNSELIVVSDGSRDKTSEKVSHWQSVLNGHGPKLEFHEYLPNRGKGFAVKTGVNKASGSAIMFMDADYAVPIEVLPQFIRELESGADIVIATRADSASHVTKQQALIRRTAAKIFGKIQRIILKIPFRDTQCGFKVFKKSVAKELLGTMEFDCAYFDAEILTKAYRKGLVIREIPVPWEHDGTTRLPIGARRTFDILKKLIRIRRMKT